jgi:uncharacterized protein (DUF362 family)
MTENYKVFLELIDQYDIDRLEALFIRGFAFLGIPIPIDKLILVKPNVLGIYTPEQCIDTHPAVVEAIVRILANNKNKIVIGDSSGNGQYGYTARALEKSGMSSIAIRYGATVTPFDKHTNRVFKNPENRVHKEINLTSFVDEVDWIVNVPKLKSHTFTRFSGAVKNFYGLVPGAGKPRGHLIAPDPIAFSHGLLDIYGFVKPKLLLNIMDAITGIEGAGPGPAGKKKQAGFIGMSAHAVALDQACLEAIGCNPFEIQSVKLAYERGIVAGAVETNKKLSGIEFDIVKSSIIETVFNHFFPGLALSKPFVVADQCKKCGLCAQACPVGSIAMKGLPYFDYSTCIHCFCCHENCPEAAIDLKDNALFRLFKFFSNSETNDNRKSDNKKESD